MMHPSGALPNESYIAGLRQSEEALIRQIYKEFRQAAIRAAALKGASPSAAARAFQAAVVEAARMAQIDTLQEEEPVFEILERLVISQFREAEPIADEPEPTVPSALDGTLAAMESWRQSPPPAGEPAPAGYEVWKITTDIERRMILDRPEGAPEPPANKAWRFGLIALVILTLGYAAYTWFNRPPKSGDVFDENFAPPESFVSDRKMRYSAVPDSSGMPPSANDCERLLEQADALYQDQQFEAAQEPLLLLVLDSTGNCQSDGWYFLSLLRLELGDPVTAIECLTKIEDLEHYSDDIQWYMAVALLQLSESEPNVREKAIRALQRVVDSSPSEDRRVKAIKMLEQLK